jgi:hypothetical protein
MKRTLSHLYVYNFLDTIILFTILCFNDVSEVFKTDFQKYWVKPLLMLFELVDSLKSWSLKITISAYFATKILSFLTSVIRYGLGVLLGLSGEICISDLLYMRTLICFFYSGAT